MLPPIAPPPPLGGPHYLLTPLVLLPLVLAILVPRPLGKGAKEAALEAPVPHERLFLGPVGRWPQ